MAEMVGKTAVMVDRQVALANLAYNLVGTAAQVCKQTQAGTVTRFVGM